MPLPHISNSEAGRNLYDPVHSCIFEVYFTLPEALRGQFGKDEMLLTEHITKIDGLTLRHIGPGVDDQKFMGTQRSYLKPMVENTASDLTVEFTLNLRNGVDNYIYKLFKAWARLSFDITTGKRTLKKDYVANWLRVSIANRVGDIIEDVVFKDIMLVDGVSGFDSFAYDSQDSITLTCKFRSDRFEDVDA